jgi:hypothetical protein
MSYLIKDEEVLREFRRIAKNRGKTLAGLLRELAQQEAERETTRPSVLDRLRPLLAKVHGDGQPSQIDWDALKHRSDADWGEAK